MQCGHKNQDAQNRRNGPVGVVSVKSFPTPEEPINSVNGMDVLFANAVKEFGSLCSACGNLDVVEHGFVEQLAVGELGDGVVVQLNVQRDDMSLVTQRARLVLVHRLPRYDHLPATRRFTV